VRNVPVKMSSEKFCLRWNDFESNISVAFRELRDDKDFFDVTLACDDEQIQAHKVILSACSPFFRNILRRNPHQHPLLYLKGVKYSDIQSVLNFMYHGEVNVAQEELNSFLAVAEELRVKGLTQGPNANANKPKHDSRPRPRSPTIQRPASPVHKRQRATAHDDEIQEVVQVPVKSEPVDHIQQLTLAPAPQPAQPKYYSPQTTKVAAPIVAPAQPSYSAVQAQQVDEFSTSTTELASYTTDVYDDQQDESYEDYGQYTDDYNGQGMEQQAGAKGGDFDIRDPSELLKYVAKSDLSGKYTCGICKTFSHAGKSHVRNHIESKHFPGVFTYECDQCEKIFSTKNGVANHRSVAHKPSSAPHF